MRALLRFDYFGVIGMTMIFTSSRFDDSLIYPNAVPTPEFHRSVASLAPARSWQSHIPFGSLFNFQGYSETVFYLFPLGAAK